MKNAYDSKIKYYNSMKRKCKLNKEFRKGVKLIPMVIGPRGQFYKKSWRDITRYLDPKFQSVKTRSSRCCPSIEKRFGSREGFISHLTLERPCLPCSGQHSTNVRMWQEHQREHWNQNELVSRVVIERPNRG